MLHTSRIKLFGHLEQNEVLVVVKEIVERLSEGLNGARLCKFYHLLVKEDQLKDSHKNFN